MERNEFCTVSKADDAFNSLLTGKFSQQQRAIPIHSFSVNTADEKVTFELKNINQIKKPFWLASLLYLSRPMYWIFTLGPLFVVMALNKSLGLEVESLLFGLSAFILIFLNMSAFCLNDYNDHLAGVDRISHTSGSQVIQKAWLAAYQVKNIAYACLFLTLLLSVPIILRQSIFAVSIAAFVAFSLFAFSYKNLGLKYKGIGELIVFVAFGPLIVAGLSQVLSEKILFEHLLFGSALGWLSMIHMQVKNWMNIMADSQVGIKTFISRLGFDRAKLYLCFQFFVLFALSLAVSYFSLPKFGAVFFVSYVFIHGLGIAWQIVKTHSPVSSNLKKIYKNTFLFNWLYCVLLVGVLLFGK